MRTPLIVLSLVALNAAACGQKVSEADVPQPARAAFMKQFPNAEHARWEMETKTEFEVNFKQGSQAMSATYGTAGNWLETEKDIKAATLPEAVRNTLANQYAGYEVKALSHVENPQGTCYEADLEKGGKSMEVVFKLDGTVLKENMEEHDNDEEGD